MVQLSVPNGKRREEFPLKPRELAGSIMELGDYSLAFASATQGKLIFHSDLWFLINVTFNQMLDDHNLSFI